MKTYIANINDFTIEYLETKVSISRVERSRKYKHEADVKRSLLAEGLLNYAVAKEGFLKTPVTTIKDEYSKPHLYIEETEEIHFSVSHSGDYAVCVVADNEVGIDIERVGEYKAGIAKRFFSDKEQKYVSDAKTFFEVWTLKESFMKITGLGMKLPMTAFSVVNNAQNVFSYETCEKGILQIEDYENSIIRKRLCNIERIKGKVIDVLSDYSLSICADSSEIEDMELNFIRTF